MKVALKEAYQGWAAIELGKRRLERVPAGTHNLPKPFVDYLKKTHPNLLVVIEPEEKIKSRKLEATP